MPFLSLSFELGARDPDTVEGICLLLGALAVTYSDQRDEPVLEPAPGEVRLWRRTRVEALFDSEADAPLLARSLAASLALPAGSIECRRVEDRTWEREWLKDFRPRRFGRRLWVAPREAQVEAADAVIVRLDPGLAFGTGSHASTAMCLEWLDSELPRGASVIDYGCGSGVLGIAAARLEARDVWCYDIDPQALTAARENAAVNGVEARVHVVESSGALPRGADVVLANILAGTLCELAPELAGLVRGGGVAVLSGILAEEAGEVTRAYRAWFDTRAIATREEWVCLAAHRSADA